MTEKLAIHGGRPVRSRPFPSWPIFGEEEEQALIRALRSGNWGRLAGSEVAQFEEAFAAYNQARHGIAVVNGTVALRLALVAGGIQAGQEVIVPPYTFLATASAVVEANATPVFVDIQRDTSNIDPAAIEAAVTENTRAIIVVHFGGLPVDMDAIQAIARRRGLLLIEDAAHAHGAEYRGQRVGAIGDMGTFSFQSSKNLTSGEGGIILTNDDDLAGRCRSIQNCGRIAGGAWYEHHTIGGNYRLGEFQGAVLNAQLSRFGDQSDTREANGTYLAGRLAQIPGVFPQARGPECTRHGYHLFAFRIDPAEFGIARDDFVAALAAEGIPALAGYKIPLYRQPLFLNRAFGPYIGRGDCPNFRRQHGEARIGENGTVPFNAQGYASVRCPNCEAICETEGVWLEHRLLLAGRQDMDDIADAVAKIRAASRSS
jgi:dTDP-4-amino-4,6-dideoxygalactose transaminase